MSSESPETEAMTPERWRKIEEIFYGALDLNQNERGAYLAESCDDDGALRHEVERLLNAGDESGRMRDVLARNLSLAVDEILVAPQRLGPYRVVREIGRGGLGTVYLAERDDEHYSMQVAIKLVRRGLDTDDILARLRQERQILARLDHPNITRLLDGGSTESGQPYLVMEYVDGMSLGAFCDQRRLTVRQRLRLMLDVCSAVAMAHRNLVIHRDIKPSNILVTEDGTVKLLDFGIAKLLDRETETEPTLPEHRLLTPEYASPEQRQGLPLSTATDIYSLGAMLYRLLTGAPAIELQNAQAGDAPPTKPSDRVAQPRGPAEAAVAEERGMSIAKLRQSLRGDLDNILLKAMATEPGERYGSVTELAEDLRRHLEDRPVRAQAPSLAILWWKFLRRNRWGSIAAALIALSLLAGLSATVWQAQRARQAQAEAERVSTFLGELLEASTPEVSRGEIVPVRSVLDQGAERIATELADDPEVQTRLMTTMGQAYFSLGVYDRAAELHRGALDIRRSLHGGDHPDVAGSANALAKVLTQEGDLEQAERWLNLALSIRRSQVGTRSIEVAETLKDLGPVYRRLRRSDEAEQALLEALDIYRLRLGEEHESTVSTLNNLGVLYLGEGRFDEAETLLRQATEIHRRLLGKNHPTSLNSLSNLARALRSQGELVEAEGLLRTMLAESRKLLGEEHRGVAAAFNSLAKVLAAQGKLDEAAVCYQQATTIFSKSLGEHKRDVATASTNLGEVLLRAERAVEAEQAFRQSLAIHRRHPVHPELARTLEALGSLLCDTGRPEEAEPLLREAVEVRGVAHSTQPTHHWRIAGAEKRLGICLLSQERFADAEPLLKAAHQELLRRFGSDNPRTQSVAELINRLPETPL